ncbi:TPA: hypothetical protein ACGPBH_000828 [Streptococcus suis]
MIDLEGLQIDEDSIGDSVFTANSKDSEYFPINIYHDRVFLEDIFNLGFLVDPQNANQDINIYLETYGLQVLSRLHHYPYLYYSFDGAEQSEDNIYKLTYMTMLHAREFGIALWLVKDNSITSNNAVTYFGKGPLDSYPDSFNSNTRNYLSTGDRNDVFFSTDELLEAGKWFEILSTKVVQVEVQEFNSNGPVIDNFPNLPSFHRAINLLLAARKSNELPAKIASYISILECVFCVKGENTQKVSERVAWFVGEDGEDRLKIFESMRKAYKERSDYIHGSMIKYTESKIEERREVIITLDDIVRKILRKLFLPKYNFLNYLPKDSEKVDKWFNSLVIKGEEDI